MGLSDVLEAWHAIALTYRESIVPTSAPSGSDVDEEAEAPASSHPDGLTPGTVANVVGVTTHAVRLARDDGRLVRLLVDGGRLYHPYDVAAWVATRSNYE